ncbi:NAD(P)-dependent oxidoreductase [Rhodoferax sp.]|uniref:NAD(P)-dependent oxidoreductase n=1 Tax=Rhodoferax sp. TaxID=50421 RepID=UPI0025E4062E|nr:NAD(P)-dependent oxidoreductase [Rhodoferax sp.]
MALNIGFIGLGSLGEGLCNSLVKAGFPVTVTDLNPACAQKLLAAGAVWADDVAGVCRGADVVITVLPSPAISRKVVEGPGGVFENLRSGGVWIEMSTTDFEDLQRLQDAATQRGIAVLECPVTGGVHLANSGQITVLVGGDEAVFQRVEPLLAAMGGQIIYMGKLGNASVVKVVTNMLAFIHLVAAGEAMMVPAKYGVDPDATYRAIRASSGNSFVHETESQLILSGSYNVKFNMDLACKDLGLVNGIAEKLGVPLELGGMTQQIFRRARGMFGSQAQSPEVVRMLEQACGLELRAPGYPTELVAE